MAQGLRNFWRSRVEAYGAQWRRPGIQSREELLDELKRMGAQVEEVLVARYTTTLTPQSVVDGIASRVVSDTWDVPDDVCAATIAELRAWAEQTYGDLSASRQEEHQFLLDVARF